MQNKFRLEKQVSSVGEEYYLAENSLRATGEYTMNQEEEGKEGN